MIKRGIASFFLITFSMCICLPSAILLVDNQTDVILLVDINEEEESKSETASDSAEKLFNTIRLSKLQLISYSHSNLEYYSKNYSSEFPDLVSPPPEHFA